MNKSARHSTIRGILTERGGSTQEQIRVALSDRGIEVSQSTLSRDLRELGAVKIPLDNGFSYRLEREHDIAYGQDDLSRAMNEYAIDQEPLGNFLVINSSAGHARDLCLVIDRQRWPEIVGTIAGDDTILVMARTAREIGIIQKKLG